MNKLLKDLIKSLKKQPAVSEEDIEKVKELLKHFNIRRKYYKVVGIYENYSYVSKDMSYKNIPYEVWYTMKFRKGRFILIDGKLLEYNLKDNEKENLDDIVDYLKNKKNIPFVFEEKNTTNKISKPD